MFSLVDSETGENLITNGSLEQKNIKLYIQFETTEQEAERTAGSAIVTEQPATQLVDKSVTVTECEPPLKATAVAVVSPLSQR